MTMTETLTNGSRQPVTNRHAYYKPDGTRVGGRVASPRPVRRKPNGKAVVDYLNPEGGHGTKTFDDPDEAIAYRNNAWAEFIAGDSTAARECRSRGMTGDAVIGVVDFPDERKKNVARKTPTKKIVEPAPAPAPVPVQTVGAGLPTLGDSVMVVGVFLDESNDAVIALRGAAQSWLVKITAITNP